MANISDVQGTYTFNFKNVKKQNWWRENILD